MDKYRLRRSVAQHSRHWCRVSFAEGCGASNPALQSHELVRARYILAEYAAASRRSHRRDHPLQLFKIVAGMIGMRIVGRPEELVLAYNLHHRRDRTFVGIGGDVTLALEVVRRLLLEPDRRAERGAVEDGVAAIEKVADPSGLRLEHYHAQLRKTVEHAQLEERSERMLHALAGEQIVIPRGPAEVVVTMVDAEAGRLEGRMYRERDAQILRGGEDGIVARVAVRYARDRKRTDECALASVLHGALEFARRFGRVTERKMRNRDQATTRVAAEIRDPSIVGAAVRGRELGVEQFRFPQKSDRRIKNRLRHRFLIQQLEALLHHHRSEGRAFEVGVFRLRREHPHLLGLCVAAHRALAQLSGVLDFLAHAAERAEQAGRGHFGALAINLEVFEAVLADADTHRAVAILRVDVFFPEVGRLEDMSVAIDHHFFGLHGINSYYSVVTRLTIQKIASGLTGDAVPRSRINGAIVNMNSLRPSPAQAEDTASRSALSIRWMPRKTSVPTCTGSGMPS